MEIFIKKLQAKAISMLMLLIVQIFLVGQIVAQTATAPSGSGTSGDPYQVATLENLYWITQNSSEWGAYYIQTADINASETMNWDGGQGFTPIGNGTTEFTGNYDGDGHIIDSLFISRSATDNVGLFGYAGDNHWEGMDVKISNLGLEHVCIIGKGYVGGLVGRTDETYFATTISNCYTTGSVSGGDPTGWYIGGLVGYNSDAEINNSYSTCTVSGVNIVGGFVGNTSGSSTIRNCYARGNVNRYSSSTNTDLAGFVGWNAGGIFNCYSTGQVIYISSTNPTNRGFSSGNTGGSYSNNFWDTQASQQSTNGVSGVATGKTTSEMNTESTFTGAGWDFVGETTNGTDDYWLMSSTVNLGYPIIMSLSGSGTAGDPYQINELYDLQIISGASALWSSYFKQMADIDASETSGWDGGQGFSPIGNNTTKFTGEYNGNGYEISNLFINRSGMSDNYIGLFGYTDGASLNSIQLVDVDITGYYYVAAVAGFATSSSIIDSCYSTGDATGNHYVGGIVGSTTSSEITACYSNCDIRGDNYSGGFVGKNGSSSIISNCYSTGMVTRSSGTYENFGGFAGQNSYATIAYCYSTGIVTYDGATDPTDKGFLGNDVVAGNSVFTANFFDMDSSFQSSDGQGGATGKTYAEMTTYATYVDNDWDFAIETTNGTGDYWRIDNSASEPDNDGYPSLVWQGMAYVVSPGITTESVTNVYADTAVGTGNITALGIPNISAYGFCWATSSGPDATDNTSNEGAASATGEFTSTITGLSPLTTYYVKAYAINDNDTVYGDEMSFTTTAHFNGAGTSGDPYQIATLEDLRNLSENSVYWDDEFIQTADIDASVTSTWNSGEGFSPIGNDVTNFTGSYNGDGYFINGLYINRPLTDFIGFYGYINNGSISNLGLTNLDITGDDYVGGLAGYAYATIEYCYTTGDINGYFEGISGLVGRSDGGSINNSYSECSVIGDYRVGGLIGMNEYTDVSNCYSTGNISGSYQTGGFVGYYRNHALASITNCYSLGDVTRKTGATDTVFGGFVGHNGATIENCYSIGSVIYEDNSNPVNKGFVAYDDGGTYTANFFDMETSQQDTCIVGEATGLTTAEMTRYITYFNEGWDFASETANGSNDYWHIDESDASPDNNGYPSLAIQGLSHKVKPYVTTQDVSNIDITSVTGNGNVVNEGTSNAYAHGICYDTSPEPTTSGDKTNEGEVLSTGTFTSDITGLEPGTLYYVRAYAANDEGVSYGEEVTFTTLEAPEVTTQSVSDVLADSAFANGTIVDLGFPDTVTCGFCWSTSTNPTIGDDTTMLLDVTNTGAFSTWITGLAPVTTYYLRAYAINDADVVYGEEVSFTTTTHFNGSGTEVDPYQISSLEDLRNLSGYIVYWNDHYIQTADINASATRNWNIENEDTLGFFPIGNNGTQFNGYYNGKGHVIDSLYINRPSLNNIGFFGYTEWASIDSLGLTNVDITGNNEVGAVVGYARNNSNISNAYATGDIIGTGSWNVGGLVGFHRSSAISNSYTNINITSDNQRVGGLVGCNFNSSTIMNSFAMGSVIRNSGTETNYGGFCGYNDNSSIENCYSTCLVVCGGLTNKGFVGDETGTTNYTNNFFDAEVSLQLSDGIGAAEAKTTTEMQSKFTYTGAGWDFMDESANGTDDFWGINANENNGYPFLEWQGYLNERPPIVTTQSVTNIEASTATGNGNITDLGVPDPTHHGVCWNTSGTPTISDNKTDEGTANTIGAFTTEITGLDPLTTYYVRTYAINNDDTVYGEEVSFSTNAHFNGSGTEVDPYQISSLEDLRSLSENSIYWEKHFIQTADIDASATSGWNSGEGFSPIGNNSILFTGSYNGNNYTVNNLFINRPSSNYQGLFGLIQNASLHHIGILNADITGNHYVAALVGQIDSSPVNNCYSSGNITGDNDVGGLISYSYNNDVDNCYSLCNVVGNVYVGGLIGFSITVNLNDSYSSGAVSGNRYVGGVLGYIYESSSVSNTYSLGNVNRLSGTDTTLAGFAGYCENTVLEYCYSTGTVTYDGAENPTNKGFIAYDDGGTYIANFWNIETSLQDTNINGTASGLTNAEMHNLDVFADAGWNTTSVWGMVASNNELSYPFLKNNAQVPAPGLTNAYAVSYSVVNGNGAITAENDIESGELMLEGANVTYTADPDADYMVKEWVNNGTIISDSTFTYTVDNLSEDITLTVEFKKIVTAWPEASNIIYGDSIGLSTLSGGTAGIPGSFAFTDSSYRPSIVGMQNVGVSFTPDDLVNYNTVFDSVSIEVETKELTVINAIAQDKVYDGTTSAVIINAELSGVVSGDDVVIENHTSGTFAQTDIGTVIAVNTAISISGADVGKYYITQPAYLSANITAKDLTITANDIAKEYGYLYEFDGTEFTTSGLVSDDEVTSATISSPGAAISAAFGDYNINISSASGIGLSNYNITYVQGTMSVEKRTLNVINAVVQNKMYDGTTDAIISGAELSGVLTGDNVTLENATTGIFVQVAAGSDISVATAMTISGDDIGNYNLVQPSLQANITPKELTVINAVAQDKVYDGTTSAVINNAELSGIVSGDDVVIENHTSGTFAQTDIGINIDVNTAISISGADAGNYSITQPSYLNADITAKALTIIANDIGKEYGNLHEFSGTEFTTDGLMNDDAISSATITSDGTAETANAGAYDIFISNAIGTGLDNYSISYTEGTLTVAPKPLTITADNITKTVGLNYDFAGTEFTNSTMVGGDEVTEVVLTSTGADTDAEIGEYPIVVSDAQGIGLDNYEIEYIQGTMYVEAKTELSLTGIVVEEKVYDGTVVATISEWGTLEEIAEGDDVTLETSQATTSFDNKNAGSDKIVSITGLMLAGDDANNYSIGAQIATGTITKRTLELSSFIADDKVYDGNTNASGTSFDDNRIENDDLSFTYDAAFVDKNVGNDKEVTFTNIVISGGTDMDNYQLTSATNVAIADITALDLNIGGSFTAQDKDYDGSTLATIDATGLILLTPITGDDVALVNVEAAFENADIGVDKTVSIISAQLSGDDKDNYNLSLTGAPTTTANITDPALPQYAVTYDGNGNDEGTAPVDTNNYFAGDEVTILGAGDLTNTGYSFDGWNTEADGSGIAYAANSTMIMPEGNVTLYAQWSDATNISGVDKDQILIYSFDGRIYFKGHNIEFIQIFDLQGRTMLKKQINSSGLHSINTSLNGYFIVVVKNKSSIRTTNVYIE